MAIMQEEHKICVILHELFMIRFTTKALYNKASINYFVHILCIQLSKSMRKFFFLRGSVFIEHLT